MSPGSLRTPGLKPYATRETQVPLMRLRDRLVDGPNSIGATLRARRWSLLTRHFPDISEMSVLDLGGRVATWERAPVRPKHVHILNLEPQAQPPTDWLSHETGDATSFESDERFDL